jgi:hypothetical protein
MIEAISVVAIFILVCSIYRWYTGFSVFRKRPRWNAQEEATLEAAQFSSYRNRLTESALRGIMGVEMQVWDDAPKRAALPGFVQDRKAEWLGGYPF